MPNNVQASLENMTLVNTDAVALATYKFAAMDKDNVGGMVLVDDASAGALVLVEEKGTDVSTGFGWPVSNIPVGQSSRCRRRGVGTARCVAIAVKAGEPAYCVMAGASKGMVTNDATSNTRVGNFHSATTGTADELVAVDIFPA